MDLLFVEDFVVNVNAGSNAFVTIFILGVEYGVVVVALLVFLSLWFCHCGFVVLTLWFSNGWHCRACCVFVVATSLVYCFGFLFVVVLFFLLFFLDLLS
jgi:hypothetical protein